MKHATILTLSALLSVSFCKEKSGEAVVSVPDPVIERIRKDAAPLVHRNVEDVGVRALDGGMYAVTHFALVSGEMSATVYDLWKRSGESARRTATLGPGRTLVQLKLDHDDEFDYLLEGGMPGTGREVVTAFLGRGEGRVEKVAEVYAPSDEAPQIKEKGMCEKTIVETLAAKPLRYAFNCATNKFVQEK